MVKICPECGAMQLHDGEFCNKCGAKLKSNHFNRNTIITVSAIILICVVGAVSYAIYADSQLQPRMTISNTDVTYSTGNILNTFPTISYSYTVYGTIKDLPHDISNCTLRSKFYDANGNLLYTDIIYLTSDMRDQKSLFGGYTTDTFVNVDHVDVKLWKGGEILDATSHKFDLSRIHQN